MYVHLPESASIMHEQYERKSPGIEGDGTIYGRHQKATAKENERVFKEFMDVLKKVAGGDKVVMLDEEPEKTEEIKRLAKST
jgi:predicted O-linked N-acetylglucosamine transferase (SPINDLY family)